MDKNNQFHGFFNTILASRAFGAFCWVTSAWCNFCRVARYGGWGGGWHGGDVIRWRHRGLSGAVYAIPSTAFGQKLFRAEGMRWHRASNMRPTVRREYRFSSGANHWPSEGFRYCCGPLDGKAQIQRLSGTGDDDCLLRWEPGNKPWFNLYRGNSYWLSGV